jgi:hypothetical protein
VCADEFSKPYGMLKKRCQKLYPGSAWEDELRSQMSRITSSGWDFVLCGFEPSFIDDIRSSSGRATTTYFLSCLQMFFLAFLYVRVFLGMESPAVWENTPKTVFS